MLTLPHDVRYAARSLRKHPGFVLAVVLILSLGIGAATAIFSVVNATILRPPPFAAPERLVRLWETNPSTDDMSSAAPNYLDWRERNRSFEDMAAFRHSYISLTDAGDPERIVGLAATASLLPLLGHQPHLGRLFGAEDERVGGNADVAVLGRGLWERRFGADSGVVGRTVTLDARRYRIIGVIEADPTLPLRADVYIPLTLDPGASRTEHGIEVVARLTPGVTIEQARADLARVARDLATDHPASNTGWGVRIASASEWLVGPRFRQTVFVLFATVGFVLLLACANVANLLLARASARHQEIGIRAALGAGRGGIVRHFLTESVLLGLVGAAGGVLVALWAVDALTALGPASIPRLDEVAMDWRVLLFALMLGLLTSVLFGLVPALQAARVNVHETLKQGARGAVPQGRLRLRDALVVCQVALAMLLLAGAGLLASSFQRLQQVDPGFDARNVLALEVTLPAERYDDGRAAAPFFTQAMERIGAIRGVRAVGVTNFAPFSGRGWVISYAVEGHESADDGDFALAGWRSVTPDFFRAMSIPLLRGRTFTAADTAGGAQVIIVSASLARRWWPDTDPIGKRFLWGGDSPKTVVGVVGDVRDVELERDVRSLVYRPFGQLVWLSTMTIIRTEGDPARMTDAVRAAIWSLDPDLPVTLAPLQASLDAAVEQPRFSMLLVSALAGVALLLASVGTYGMMSFTVAQRTRELGIRTALGAQPRRVMRLVMGHVVLLALAGVGAGAAGALVLTRFLESLLYATPTTDVPTYVVGALVLLGAAAAASYLPARRATRVSPMLALRSD